MKCPKCGKKLLRVASLKVFYSPLGQKILNRTHKSETYFREYLCEKCGTWNKSGSHWSQKEDVNSAELFGILHKNFEWK